jgi:hypothetical protein
MIGDDLTDSISYKVQYLTPAGDKWETLCYLNSLKKANAVAAGYAVEGETQARVVESRITNRVCRIFGGSEAP